MDRSDRRVREKGAAAPTQVAAAATHTGPDSRSSVLANALTVLRVLNTSRVRRSLRVLTLLIAVVAVVISYSQVLLFRWSKPFLDAWSRRDLHDFLLQLGVFGIVAMTMLVVTVILGWIGETLKVRVREGLVRDLVHLWMQPGRASALARSGLTEPIQHLNQDARNLTEFSVDLGVGLLQATLVTGVFFAVLWGLSGDATIRVGDRDIVIRGYMAWIALAYAMVASLLAYWVGRRLVQRNAELAAREADFNRSLARVHENIDAISLASGEASEERRIERAFDSLLAAMQRVVTNLTNFSWVSSGYTVFTRVAPAVAGAVLYFSGRLTVGGFAIASLAFVQLQSSLRWFIDNFHKMAKWRESLDRVANFHRVMIVGDSAGRLESRIAIVDGEAGKIVVENLSISSPSGTSVASEERLEIVSGERLLIVAAGDLPVLLALAGLWPRGSGRIARPKTEEIVYLPRVTYLPHGTLREVLAYPSRVEDFGGAELFPGVLARLGMNRLVPLLDSTQRWDQVLSEDERHCVGFARAVLRKPSWLVVDRVLDLVHGPALERLLDVSSVELAATGIIYIGHERSAAASFSRMTHIYKA
jgi:vitamin B12/bleomycin/antimicrobial peptide transport system ATP-binding/permease protein